MVNSLTQIATKMVENFFEISFEGNLDEYIEKQQANFNECLRQTIQCLFEDIDTYLFDCKEIREEWETIKKDVPRQVTCQCGLIEYKRRYYRHQGTREYAYLTDIACGIEKYSKISSGTALRLVERATDVSYQKSSDIVTGGLVSKQTVKNKIKQIEDYELEPVPRDTNIKKIHLQADEDHISLQGEGSNIVKLVTMHEDTIKENRTKNKLVNKIDFTPYPNESNREFWERICFNIEKRYGLREDLTVYIHGDGANWIKTGLEEIPGSKPILDKFHMEKYIKRIYQNKYEYRTYIMNCLQTNRYNLLKTFLDTLVANDEITEQDAQEVYRYLFNNRKGITNALTLGLDGRSCAEGLVSHTLSERLSSRPCAWSEEGAANLASIRVFIKNGGKLREENLIHHDEVLMEHQSRIKEITAKKIVEAEHEFHIRDYVPKRSAHTWLKDIARSLCS